MTSIFRNQNRRLKITIVVSFYKLVANASLLEKEKYGLEPIERHRGEFLDGYEKSAILNQSIFLRDKGGFPYNIQKSNDFNAVHNKQGWFGEEEVAVPSKGAMRKRKVDRNASLYALSKHREKQNEERLARINSKERNYSVGWPGGNRFVGVRKKKTIEQGKMSKEREASLQRNQYVSNTDLHPLAALEVSRIPELSIVTRDPHSDRLHALASLLPIYRLHRERRTVYYLFKWYRGNKFVEVQRYLEEFENLNIVLAERAFREKVFRTKVKLMQEQINTQVKMFEEVLHGC